MSTPATPVGSILWTDLTVSDAESIRRFYQTVVGWEHAPVDMGGYSDYCMNLPGSGKTVAGICHARGENAHLPPQWLIYITVADLDESVRKYCGAGGQVVAPIREMGGGRMAVIRDPAGAVAALHQPNPAAA